MAPDKTGRHGSLDFLGVFGPIFGTTFLGGIIVKTQHVLYCTVQGIAVHGSLHKMG